MIAHLSYFSEGRGLTHDGKSLILSDRASTLPFLDPESFRPIRYPRVTNDKGVPVINLDEL